jgi:hypothetical protein
MIRLKTWAAAVALSAATGLAQAALVLQANGQEVLDTETNLLWLYDWGHFNGEGFFWSWTRDWAASLTVGGAKAGDWRLPELSEFQDLWSDPSVGGTLAGLQSHFTGVQDFFYWTGSLVSQGSMYDTRWSFNALDGSARAWPDFVPLQAVAVREVPVAQPVPEPQSLLLALTGGLLAMRVGRRRRH